MSPSEADLRAALREGEGDRFDPDDIISSVHHARARRRTMLLSAAAAVVVVGGTAAGVTALVNGSGSPSNAGGANGSANANIAAGSNAAIAPNNPRLPHSNMHILPGVARAPRCPTQQGSGSSNQGAPGSGSLLPGPVSRFVVCPYSVAVPAPRAAPQAVVVSGLAARQLAHSLRGLSATSHPRDCPMIASTASTALRIVPITPTGQHLPTITANIGRPTCETVVTNGSAVRYGWQLPPRVAALLHLSPGGIGLTPLPNGRSGPPPR